jgi:hypothetical protein
LNKTELKNYSAKGGRYNLKEQKTIGADTVVSHAARLVASDLDEKKVMMNIESGKYFGLDSVGSRIWVLLEKPHTVRELALDLLKEYDVEENTCLKDVLVFLNKLYDQGLIDIA